MNRRVILLGIIAGLAVGVACSPACADTIQLALTSPNQTASPGDTVSFIATVTAPLTNTGSVFLNSDSHTEDLGLTVDDSPFLLNFPLFMNAGDSTTDVLFNVTVSGPGTFSGFFDLLGGADASSSDLLATAHYSITVSAVPEPETILLMATNVLALISIRKYRRAGDRARLNSSPSRRE